MSHTLNPTIGVTRPIVNAILWTFEEVGVGWNGVRGTRLFGNWLLEGLDNSTENKNTVCWKGLCHLWLVVLLMGFMTYNWYEAPKFQSFHNLWLSPVISIFIPERVSLDCRVITSKWCSRRYWIQGIYLISLRCSRRYWIQDYTWYHWGGTARVLRLDIMQFCED